MAKKEVVPNRQYTGEFKQEAVRLAGSIGGNATAKRLGVPQSTVTNWVRRAREGVLEEPRGEGVSVRRPVSELEAEVSRLRRELASTKLDLEIVKKSGGVFREGVAVRYAWIEEHRDLFSVSRMCRQLDISRTGFCQWRTRQQSERSKANQRLDAQVAAIHWASRRSYGRERIHRQMHEQGIAVGRERIRKSLRRQGLRPVYRRAGDDGF